MQINTWLLVFFVASYILGLGWSLFLLYKQDGRIGFIGLILNLIWPVSFLFGLLLMLFIKMQEKMSSDFS